MIHFAVLKDRFKVDYRAVCCNLLLILLSDGAAELKSVLAEVTTIMVWSLHGVSESENGTRRCFKY
jgi:hypothetical protein